jgi:hypothetical protein
MPRANADDSRVGLAAGAFVPTTTLNGGLMVAWERAAAKELL